MSISKNKQYICCQQYVPDCVIKGFTVIYEKKTSLFHCVGVVKDLYKCKSQTHRKTEPTRDRREKNPSSFLCAVKLHCCSITIQNKHCNFF